MKKTVLVIVALLISGNLYAADGDLIVNGKLGVGSSPVLKLQAAGPIFSANSTNNSGIYITGDSGPYGLVQATNSTNSTATNMVLQQYGGNVGIGTTSPDHKLTVNGNIGFDQNNQWLYFANTSGTLNSYIGKYIDNNTYLHNDDGAIYLRHGLGSSVNFGNKDGVVWGFFSGGTYKLVLAGDAIFNGFVNASDSKYKKDLQSIDDPLGKVLNLKGISYKWKTDEFPDKGFSDGRHYGVIAQEIETVLPEVVKEGPDNDKAVAYIELIPVLIEAMKEQQKIIDKQQASIDNLQAEIDELKAK